LQTIRGIGFVSLFAAVVSCPALLSGSKILTRPRKARQLFDRAALKDRLFLIYTGCSFFTFLGYIVPYFYIPTYAKDKLGMSESMALYMLVISIAASFFGRLAGGIGGHYFGSIFSWMVCALASGVLSLTWISITDQDTFIAFSVLWGTYGLFKKFWHILRPRANSYLDIGFFSAGLVTLPSAAFASICPDLSRLGTRLGMSMSVSSIATLIGAPIAGALLSRRNGKTNFLGVQLWSGIFLLFGTAWLSVLWAFTAKSKKKGWKV
jgi:MFS family permease